MESRISTIRNTIVGIILGITSMLPGISGATMSVAFGVYERLIRDVANLRKYLFEDFRFILTLVIGAVAGTLLCAKLLQGTLEAYPVATNMFFVGLILGQVLPQYRTIHDENKKGGYSSSNVIAFVIGLLIMIAMVVVNIIGDFGQVEIGHDLTGMVMMFFIGIIVAVSMILPGISHSTILLVFGLMNAFLAAVGDLDVTFLVPLALGAVIGIFGFAKVFQKALENHHLTALFFIMGLTLGSVLVILSNAVGGISSLTDALIAVVFLDIGLALSHYSYKLGNGSD